jgi:hypothetical protein
MSLSGLSLVAFRRVKMRRKPDVRFLDEARKPTELCRVREEIGAASPISSESSNPPSDATHVHAARKIDDNNDSESITVEDRDNCESLVAAAERVGIIASRAR